MSDCHTISQITVNYNGAALLHACLASALATLPPNGEVLVVDNASTDNSRALLAGYAPQARLVPAPRNLGFGRACNLGAAVACGDLLVFANPDVEFTTGWAETLATAAWSDPTIGLLCPQTIAPGAPPPDITGPAIEPQAALPGCCLAARRDVWHTLGGFDEQFFLYWEDTELCWRAWLLGWQVVTARKSWVYHAKGATTSSFGRWDGERAKNSLYTYLKLMRWPVVLVYATRLLVVCLIKIVLRPRLAPELLRAWVWNIAHLPRTIAARRAIQRRRIGAYATLEQRMRQHDLAQRRARASTS